MIRQTAWMLAPAVWIILSANAQAGALNYTARVYGPNLIRSYNSPVALPDLKVGGVVEIDKISSLDLREATSTSRGYSDETRTYHLNADGLMSLTLGLPDDLAGKLGAWGVSFSGTLRSDYAYTPYGHRLGGTVKGTFHSAQWLSPTPVDLSAVPPELLDLMAHPERLRIEGLAYGHILETMHVNLTLETQAATPTPEPSTLALLGVAALGSWARQRRGRRASK